MNNIEIGLYIAFVLARANRMLTREKKDRLWNGTPFNNV